MFSADITPWKWQNLQEQLGLLFFSSVNEMILLILNLTSSHCASLTSGCVNMSFARVKKVNLRRM